MTKIKMTCPDCGKIKIMKISKRKTVLWTHKCDLHYYFINMRVVKL
jgi:predicted RNA-binding Zn-ribbon protein involved in translation (DUF1610 family)